MKRKFSFKSIIFSLILFMFFSPYIIAAPEGGFPDESNTGVLPGTDFKTSEQRTITTDNTVIEGERIIANNFTPYCGKINNRSKECCYT